MLFNKHKAKLDGPARRRGKRRLVEIGWLLDANQATFVYNAPRPVARKGPPAPSAKALPYCPAVIDWESRNYEIPCPFDLRLRVGKTQQGNFGLIDAAGKQSTVTRQHLAQLASLLEPHRWVHPDRPVLQILTPYRLLADESVWVTQLPPFNAVRQPAWPGLMIGERWSIYLWPRLLTWTFEWHDTSRELVLKRGDPWLYLGFESDDPDRPIRLVEAEMNEALRGHCTGLDHIDSYSREDFLATAKARRPEVLLKKMAR